MTDSALIDTNIARNGNVVFKLTSLNDFPLQGGPVIPTGEFRESLYSFYVTDSPLSVIILAEMAVFYLNWPVLMIFPFRDCQLVQLLTLSKIQIVLYVLLT